MERLIKTNGFTVKTTVPDEACQTCLALYGEMGKALTSLRLEPGEIAASAICSARLSGTRHISIEFQLKDKILKTDMDIRHWLRREVHCSKH